MGISMHWWRRLIWEWDARSHVCLCKTILLFCYKEPKCYIQILKGKTEWQDQKLVKVVCWLNLDSKYSIETGLQSMAEQPKSLVMPTIVSVECVQVNWYFQWFKLKRTSFCCWVSSDKVPICCVKGTNNVLDL